MTKRTSNRYSPEVRERAVRMVLVHASDHPSHGGHFFEPNHNWFKRVFRRQKSLGWSLLQEHRLLTVLLDQTRQGRTFKTSAVS